MIKGNRLETTKKDNKKGESRECSVLKANDGESFHKFLCKQYCHEDDKEEEKEIYQV